MVMRSANSNQNNSNSSSAQVGGRASPPPSAVKPNANNATSVVNMNPPRTPLTPSNQKHIAAQPHSHSHSNAPTTPPTAKQQAGAPRTPPLSTEKQLAAAESKEHAMPPRDASTAVKVALRARPLSAKERAKRCRECLVVDPNANAVTLGKERHFAFDTTFDANNTQEDIYETCVSELVDATLDGYNATVLAYGQTGSGKTFTMGTGELSYVFDEEMGVLPRAIRQLFDSIEARTAAAKSAAAGDEGRTEMTFTVRCQYLEVLNEEVRDLLHPETSTKSISIREAANGTIVVQGAREVEARCFADAMRCIERGAHARTTGKTLMNERSSRSHAIFTVIIEQRYSLSAGQPPPSATPVKQPSQRRLTRPGTAGSRPSSAARERPTPVGGGGSGGGGVVRAKFHLVDLAGSERNKRTGASGARFAESVTINRGLLALGNVISALAANAAHSERAAAVAHIPYRESRLTRMLSDSLGGNSRTWMIACVSKSDRDFEETLNTCKYAHRARSIRKLSNAGIAEKMDSVPSPLISVQTNWDRT